MKSSAGRILAVTIFPVVLAGCMGGPMVKKESITGTRRIAVVSVVMPRLADTSRESSKTMLQGFADRAFLRVRSELGSVRNWTVVDPAGSRTRTALMSLAGVSDQEVAALLPQGAEQSTFRQSIDGELAQWKQSYVGAKGLPIVPRSALVGDTGDTAARTMVPQIMRKRAATLCGTLDVDAVAFVQVLANVSHPKPKTFIVIANRTDGTVRMAQTLVIVDRTGQVIVDMGWPPLDARAKHRDLLPLYLGSGHGAVKQENIDLGDPKNKIAHAISSLIDETTADMVNGLLRASR